MTFSAKKLLSVFGTYL